MTLLLLAATCCAGALAGRARGRLAPDVAPVMVPPPTGTGHTAAIDHLAVAPAGDAAVTVDGIGGIRYWPALDGSREPLAIPVRGARDVHVGAAGTGHLVAIVDTSGGTKLFRTTSLGTLEKTGELAPLERAIAARVVDGAVVVLGEDRALRLVDAKGKELARFEKRGLTAHHLEVAAGGLVIALAPGHIQRVRVDAAKGTLVAVDDHSYDYKAVAHMGRGVCSPSGARCAVVSQDDPKMTREWKVTIVDLDKKKQWEAGLSFATHLAATMGFASESKLMVGVPNFAAWEVDVVSGEATPAPVPANITGTVFPIAYAGHLRVSPTGAWLRVEDTTAGTHRYLGYERLQPYATAISPSGRYAAWATSTGDVYVDALDGSAQLARIERDPMMGVHFPVFLDDEHVILSTGNPALVRLVEWKTGHLVASFEAAASFAELDAARGLLRLVRPPGHWIYEVSPDGFKGPYIVFDGSTSGSLLAGKTSSDAALMTIDNTGGVRRYTLDELRARPSQEEAEKHATDGKKLPSDQIFPAAFDRTGTRYQIGLDPTGRHYAVHVHGAAGSTMLTPGSVAITQVIPSPTGDRVVMVESTGAMRGYDVAANKQLWSFSAGVFAQHTTFSPSGDRLAIATQAGTVILDAATGEVVHRRCEVVFEARATAPTDVFSLPSVTSVCEL